jgi:hypothetical protein
MTHAFRTLDFRMRTSRSPSRSRYSPYAAAFDNDTTDTGFLEPFSRVDHYGVVYDSGFGWLGT